MLPQAVELSSTSALVLLWADSECYRSRLAGQFMRMLDLRAGRELYEACNGIWPHYAEVIRNRKFAVLKFMERCVAENPLLRQIVVAGAGLAPLSVEWKARHPESTVFDLDRAHVGLKRALLEELGDPAAADIRCVEADLARTDRLRESLLDALWRPARPTLLVMEGLSYYLPPATLHALVNLFRGPGHQGRAVVEYLLPPEQIAPARRTIPEEVFGLIRRRCGLEQITRLTAQQLAGLVEARVLARTTLHQAERLRTGRNAFFPTPESGWIEVSLLET